MENIHEYLRLISDVETRWNSSYLAWKRLIKIKDLVEIMATTMMIDPDPSTKYDGRRLRNINLTEEEWQAIGELIIILEDFAEATEYLGGSKYTTISLMYSILEIISQKLLPDDSEVEIVDLSNPNTAFDDNIGYTDAPEDDTEGFKSRKISINSPQNCFNLKNKVKTALYNAIKHYWNVPQEHGMLATLLDPRFKDLEFASEVVRTKTLEQIKKAYQDINNLANNNQEIECSLVKSNSFLARMFQNSNNLDEVDNYLASPKIHFENCPLSWWKNNESRFPILSKLAKKYLAIPATSTSSERLFSQAGNIMTIKRTQLTAITFENLIFCKKNWQLAGGIFPVDT